MRRGIALCLCVMLAAAGFAWGRVDVGGWLNAVGEVRTESVLTMGPYSIHRILEVAGTVSNGTSGSYEDWDGAWAWMANFDVSGHLRLLNEVTATLDDGSGSLELRGGVWFDGDCTAHFWDFDAILGDGTSGWVRAGRGADGTAEGTSDPNLVFRTWLYGGGANTPAEVHAATGLRCISDSAFIDKSIEFPLHSGETGSIDAGWDALVSNESFSIWAAPHIWINSW